MHALTAKNLYNVGAHQIIEISSILYSAHIFPKDQDKFVFYINNYIHWDQFNQLYNPDWMEKSIRNADVITRKLKLASTRATNDRLEAAKKKKQKKEEMIERRKAKAMAAKQRRVRGEMSLSSEKEDKSDTGDNTDPDQADNKYPLQP